MTVQDIIHLRKFISVLKHEKGKISLQVSLKALTDAKILALMQIMGKKENLPPALLHVSVEKLSRILHLEYDTNLIEANELETILTTKDRTEFNTLTEKYLHVLSV